MIESSFFFSFLQAEELLFLIFVCSHLVRGGLAVLRCTAVALVEDSEAQVDSRWWTTARCLLDLMSVVGMLLLTCQCKTRALMVKGSHGGPVDWTQTVGSLLQIIWAEKLKCKPVEESLLLLSTDRVRNQPSSGVVFLGYLLQELISGITLEMVEGLAPHSTWLCAIPSDLIPSSTLSCSLAPNQPQCYGQQVNKWTMARFEDCIWFNILPIVYVRDAFKMIAQSYYL